MRLSSILATFLLLTFVSCKKGKADFVIKGTITDQTFAVGLSDATVELFGTEAGSSSENLIATTTTDGSGNYSFTIPRDKMEAYSIRINKSLYFEIHETISFSSLTIEEDNIRNYSTTAKSWVKLRFINQNPQQGDELMYTQEQGKSSCSECCAQGDNFLEGSVDTTIYCINDGNTTYAYHYWILNTSIHGSKNVVTQAFDTTELLLEY